MEIQKHEDLFLKHFLSQDYKGFYFILQKAQNRADNNDLGWNIQD